MDAKNKNMHFKCEVGLALLHFWDGITTIFKVSCEVHKQMRMS